MCKCQIPVSVITSYSNTAKGYYGIRRMGKDIGPYESNDEVNYEGYYYNYNLDYEFVLVSLLQYFNRMTESQLDIKIKNPEVFFDCF